MHLSVPGNILLLGEYAVLEEGGLGLAAATTERVAVRAQHHTHLRIEGCMGAGKQQRIAVDWPVRDSDSRHLRLQRGGSRPARLLIQVLQTVDDYLRRAAAPQRLHNLRAIVHIDSSALFDAAGRKRGLGSSAAVTVAICAMLLRLVGWDSRRLFHIALAAHRHAQGGRGSGYDVAASTFGGCGIFRGGVRPHWQPLHLRQPLVLYGLRGRRPVDSSMAIARYMRWRRGYPQQWRAFVQRSNIAVRRFCTAAEWSQARAQLVLARENGIRLGRAIGVSGDIPLPLRGKLLSCAPHALFKAAGAGNELIMALAPIAWEAVLGSALQNRLGAYSFTLRLSNGRPSVEWARATG